MAFDLHFGGHFVWSCLRDTRRSNRVRNAEKVRRARLEQSASSDDEYGVRYQYVLGHALHISYVIHIDVEGVDTYSCRWIQRWQTEGEEGAC